MDIKPTMKSDHTKSGLSGIVEGVLNYVYEYQASIRRVLHRLSNIGTLYVQYLEYSEKLDKSHSERVTEIEE